MSSEIYPLFWLLMLGFAGYLYFEIVARPQRVFIFGEKLVVKAAGVTLLELKPDDDFVVVFERYDEMTISEFQLRMILTKDDRSVSLGQSETRGFAAAFEWLAANGWPVSTVGADVVYRGDSPRLLERETGS